ncbi:hypothetical protein HA402_009326 [Bradysia odoriphaga]|nr:hypothetical protein HA402_009326 [Bradysia odoriphaga]
MFLRSTLTNLPRITHRNVVRTCTHQVTSQPTEPTSDWKTIYKMPAASALAKLSKLKVIQAGITVIGSPVAIGLQSMQMIDAPSAEVFVILGVTGTVSLTLYSLLATNVVGFIYVNPVLRKIRFAYIDFWGRRKNLDVSPNELVSSAQKRVLNTYTVVMTTTPTGSLKLLKHGTVLDEEMVFRLFGDISEPK